MSVKDVSSTNRRDAFMSNELKQAKQATFPSGTLIHGLLPESKLYTERRSTPQWIQDIPWHVHPEVSLNVVSDTKKLTTKINYLVQIVTPKGRTRKMSRRKRAHTWQDTITLVVPVSNLWGTCWCEVNPKEPVTVQPCLPPPALQQPWAGSACSSAYLAHSCGLQCSFSFTHSIIHHSLRDSLKKLQSCKQLPDLPGFSCFGQSDSSWSGKKIFFFVPCCFYSAVSLSVLWLEVNEQDQREKGTQIACTWTLPFLILFPFTASH